MNRPRLSHRVLSEIYLPLNSTNNNYPHGGIFLRWWVTFIVLLFLLGSIDRSASHDDPMNFIFGTEPTRLLDGRDCERGRERQREDRCSPRVKTTSKHRLYYLFTIEGSSRSLELPKAEALKHSTPSTTTERKKIGIKLCRRGLL